MEHKHTEITVKQKRQFLFDLDLDLMNLIFKLDLDIVKICLYTENEVSSFSG